MSCIARKLKLKLEQKYANDVCVGYNKESGLIDICFFNISGDVNLIGSFILSPIVAKELINGLESALHDLKIEFRTKEQLFNSFISSLNESYTRAIKIVKSKEKQEFVRKVFEEMRDKVLPILAKELELEDVLSGDKLKFGYIG